jgi:hypothetical protein
MEPSLLEMLDEREHAEWAERLFQNGVRRFGNLAGLEAGELMSRLPELPVGTASELILESREREECIFSPVTSPVPQERGVPVASGFWERDQVIRKPGNPVRAGPAPARQLV